jgi:hypothetical protein
VTDFTIGFTPWKDWTTPPPLPPAPPLSPPLSLQQCNQETRTNVLQTDWGYVPGGRGQGRKLAQYADYWTSPKIRCLAATHPDQCDYRCAIYWTFESLRAPPVASPPPTAASTLCTTEYTFQANNGFTAWQASSCECCQSDCPSECRELFPLCYEYTVKGIMNGSTCGWSTMSPPPSGLGQPGVEDKVGNLTLYRRRTLASRQWLTES